MFKPKTTISGRLENSSGEWIRTTDLRVINLYLFWALARESHAISMAVDETLSGFIHLSISTRKTL